MKRGALEEFVLPLRHFQGARISERVDAPSDCWALVDRIADRNRYDLAELVEEFLTWAALKFRELEKEWKESGVPDAPELHRRDFKGEDETRDIRLSKGLLAELKEIGKATSMTRAAVSRSFLPWAVTAFVKRYGKP